MKKIIKFILNSNDENNNKLYYNYFYITTILVIISLCVCHFCFDKQMYNIFLKNKFYNIILMPFRHSDVKHLTGNIFCFSVVSLFLERHFGSLKYIFIILLSTFPASVATFLFSESFYWVGFSGVLYILYALFFIEVLFNFKKYILKKFENIFTLIIMGVIIFLMIDGNNLISNISHWSSMIIGGIIGLMAHLIVRVNKNNKTENVVFEEIDNNKYIK